MKYTKKLISCLLAVLMAAAVISPASYADDVKYICAY